MEQNSKTMQVEELEVIYQIVKGTADATGERFFKEVVRHMASALGVRCSLLSRSVRRAPSVSVSSMPRAGPARWTPSRRRPYIKGRGRRPT